MRIAFDISQTGSDKAGCGYFAHAMIKALLELGPEHHYSLLPSFGDFYFNPLMTFRRSYSGRNLHYGPRHLTRESAHTFWGKTDLEVALGKPDIIHSNNFWCPVQLTSSRLIYTFYDMAFSVEPAWSTESNRVGCFEGVFRSAIAADWVVAISQASRTHYLNSFPSFPDKYIRVIYPCSRFSNPQAHGTRPKALNSIPSGKFWLNVGTIEPRKNQRRLAQAYARYLALGGSAIPLVLAGSKGWLMQDFQQHLDALGITASVVMTGRVSDDELIWLYRNCYANIYPSLFEGFGLPVLEGMQFGAPTLTSDSTSIPEVAGKAAILLHPEDTEEWAQVMLRLSVNRAERDHLSIMSREQAAKFDWKHSAASLLDLYDEAFHSPKRNSAKQCDA